MRNPLARRPGVPEPSRDPRPGGTPRRDGPGVLGWAQRIVVGAVVAVLLGWVLLFYVFAPKLPDPRELRAQSEQPTITVLAADGSVLARRGTEGARFIALGEISPWLVKAVVATEDARFYHHFGLDPLGLARAFLVDLKARHVVEGGSTITQQLVKNLYLSSEQTAGRKLQERVYAIWLETQLSKDEILTLYLDRVYFGAGAYGVEAAAQRYFAKPAKDLTLAEAAMVAGLLKAPSRYAPTNDLDESATAPPPSSTAWSTPASSPRSRRSPPAPGPPSSPPTRRRRWPATSSTGRWTASSRKSARSSTTSRSRPRSTRSCRRRPRPPSPR